MDIASVSRDTAPHQQPPSVGRNRPGFLLVGDVTHGRLVRPELYITAETEQEYAALLAFLARIEFAPAAEPLDQEADTDPLLEHPMPMLVA